MEKDEETQVTVTVHANKSEPILQRGGANYTAETGINSTSVTYQDASGAPVEVDSPLGYSCWQQLTEKVVGANTKWSLRVVVWFGVVKIATLVMISIAGLVVLGGHTKVPDPQLNWRNAWEGTSEASAYGATNAMMKLIFSYAGYTNAFSVANEIKNPVKTLRWSAPFSLILVTSLYILVNVAYFSAASREEILSSKQIAAGIFFEKVFGTNGAARALNVLICINAFGNLIAVMINYSRMLRETGRQGVLPWSKFWTSTRPFGTPLGPYTVQWAITVIMILAPPAGDAFNFVVDLSVYPTSIFNFLLVVGLLVIRRRRRKFHLPRPEYRAWSIAIVFALLTNLYLLVAPWYPPSDGANGGDVSFWYGTYLVVGIGLLLLCGIYYYVWIEALPKYKGYQYRQSLLEFDDGSVVHKLVKVSNTDLDNTSSPASGSGLRQSLLLSLYRGNATLREVSLDLYEDEKIHIKIPDEAIVVVGVPDTKDLHVFMPDKGISRTS
ncbi:uncharacterized protein ATNIH1004_005209 [Aspergillus tanneri]|uniref:Amino acid permease/ SLC12A domain-containing protein n=1 Tax=Aspergillus tanneri TaxID=1220188 RepID=A0A5M9MQY8_9EURO|nr:uncharacterized protein ATNIH1004_005209 [Aspergillus tanneri]KAA8649308.1 hypothetical protein ATNIH1004_005209 [Aspergillus tanneri]